MSDKKKAKRSKDKHRKKAKAPRILALPPPDRRDDPALLDRCRLYWQHGNWDELAKLNPQGLAHRPDGDKLALMVATAHGHLGDFVASRHWVAQAIDWGCSRTLAAQVLISSVHNTLGKVATSLEDPSATSHFAAALEVVDPKGDLPLLSRSRQIHETTRMGLLTEAADLLAIDVSATAEAPSDHDAKLAMISTRLMQLKHELSLSLNRGQLHRGPIGSPKRLRQRSVAQLGQDLWVLEKSGYKRGGFFVEFGATDGVLLSNTLLLERDFGWTGILAEPNPNFFAELQFNRTCTLSRDCIGPRSGETVDFLLADEYGGISDYLGQDHNRPLLTGYAAGGQTLRLTTVSLDEFLKRHGAPRTIDYLSIDTEGSEYEILRAFPFDQWSIRLLTVEHNYTARREEIRQFLAEHGYQRTEKEWDDWYELIPQRDQSSA